MSSVEDAYEGGGRQRKRMRRKELVRDSTLDHPVDEPKLTVRSAWCAFSEVAWLYCERTLKQAKAGFVALVDPPARSAYTTAK